MQSRRAARAALVLGYTLAAFFVLVGLAGALGAFTDLDALSAPLDGWPPLRPFGALAMGLLGVALWGNLRRLHKLATVASALTALAGVAVVAAYIASIRLPGGGMALASAAMLTTAAVALFIESVRRRPFADEDSLGIAGAILVALSTTFVIARFSGLIDPMTDRAVAGSSIQVVAGAFLLGVCFLALAWSRGLLSGESAQWLPIAFGVASAVTVLVLWRALDAREGDHVRSLTRQAADETRLALARETAATARSLGRAAEWRSGGASTREERRDVLALRRDVAGLGEVGWIDPAGALDPAAPAAMVAAGANAAASRYVRTAGGLPDSIAYLPLDSAGTVFLIVAPSCRNGRCQGAVVGVAHTVALFRTTLGDPARGSEFSLASATAILWRAGIETASDARWTQRLPLDLGGVHFVLSAWPNAVTLKRERSALPVLVLLLGLVVSALTPLTIVLAQRARRTAREAERVRIAAALERSTEGIWEWDPITDSAVHSAGIWRHLGYDPETVPPVRGAWLDLVHPDDRARLRAAIDLHLSGVAPTFEAEYRVLAKDGKWHTIVDRGSVVDRTPIGMPARMLGIKADITATRTAEQARFAAEKRFREIFDIGIQFQLLLDRGGTVLEVNKYALEEAGASEGDVRGRPVWETLWWAGHPEAQTRLREAVAAGFRGATRRYEEQPSGPNGTPIFLEINVKPFLDEAGEPTQLLVEARDLTERRRAEATRQEVDTLTTMGRIAARVAHEINNPLAGIQSSFLLIKGAVPLNHPHYKYVGAIEREIDRIAAVTQQLYETYRPETDATGMTSIGTVVGDAVAFLEQVNRAANVRVRLDLSRCPSVIALPSAMLRQIVYNLVQNAIEASPPGAIVQLEASCHADLFQISVRDHGAGIPAETKPRIFEPFFSTKGDRFQTAGMGLGLALVHRTVTAAGGTIVVRDVDGGGTEFLVTLPLNTTQEGE